MPDTFEVNYEMGYGADEFGKVLQGPFSGDKSPYGCVTLETHYWRIEQPQAEFDLTIRVAEQPPRELGMFRLPVLAVNFTFTATEEALRKAFFHRFHQYFHKGGG